MQTKYVQRFPYNCNYMIKGIVRCDTPCINERCYDHVTSKTYLKCEGIGCEKYTYAASHLCTPCGQKSRNKKEMDKKKIIRIEKTEEARQLREEVEKRMAEEKIRVLRFERDLKDKQIIELTNRFGLLAEEKESTPAPTPTPSKPVTPLQGLAYD